MGPKRSVATHVHMGVSDGRKKLLLKIPVELMGRFPDGRVTMVALQGGGIALVPTGGKRPIGSKDNLTRGPSVYYTFVPKTIGARLNTKARAYERVRCRAEADRVVIQTLPAWLRFGPGLRPARVGNGARGISTVTGEDRDSPRALAYRAIDSERDYQDAGRGNARRHEGRAEMTPGEIILASEKCLADARAAWYAPDGGTACLDHLRKVAALAVKAMELYGAPLRPPR